jgi:hypothetical protein
MKTTDGAIAIRAGSHTSTAIVLAFALYAIALALTSRPTIALDDAAITFRYAERLATGKGLTFNDHERVLGTSNPLYAIVLAAPIALGFTAEKSADAIGITAYALCVALVVLASFQLVGPLGGVASGLLLTSDAYFRFQALAGLEVGFAAALGMGTVVALIYRRMGLAGVLAGLGVVTKLDGMGLLAAVVFAAAVSDRRLLRRFIIGCATASVPWLVYGTWYYGSPIPQSLAAKLAGGEGQIFDRLWTLRFLMDPSRRFTTLLALTCALPWATKAIRDRTTITVLVSWAGFHALAYSLIDLGAPYPWYLAVPVAPLSVLAGTASGRLARDIERFGLKLWWLAPLVALAVVALAVSVQKIPGAWRPRPLQAWEAFESDRRAAGVFLRLHAGPGEVLECAYGWPAFESRLPTNDRSGLNSRELLGPVSYRVEHGQPIDHGAHPPSPPAGMVPLAKFDSASRLARGYSWFVLYGRPDSAIAQSGSHLIPES